MVSTSHTGLRDLCTDFSYSNSVALLEKKEKTVWPREILSIMVLMAEQFELLERHT